MGLTESTPAIETPQVKTSWPEVVGMNGDDAKALIKKEFTGDVYLMRAGMPATADYNTNRVRIIVRDSNMTVVNGNYVVTGGTVTRTPQVG